MKFKFDYQNNFLWKLDRENVYEIPKEQTFTDSYRAKGFILESDQPNHWISFTVYDRVVRVFYKQVSKSNGSKVITCYQKDIPKEVVIEFELTEKDIVMKRDDRWIKKNS